MGMSIVAACLPTLRPLFSDTSPEAFSNLLRSLFTRRSKSSSTLDKVHAESLRKDGEVASNSSRVGFAFKAVNHDVATEIYPMGDLEAQADVPSKRIMVQNMITQTSSAH